MIPSDPALVLAPWVGPPAMDPGSPDPHLRREGDIVWVTYVARDPEFPGWDSPDAAEYLERNPGETFGVLCFEDVSVAGFGPPNDETLRSHALHARGLEPYGFHSGRLSSGSPCWLVTFHDETLFVVARTASFCPAILHSESEDAAIQAAQDCGLTSR